MLSKFSRASCFLFSLLFCVQVFAANQTNIRKTFLSAEKKLWQASSSEYQNLYKQLHYYPLQPYLDQQRLLHKMSVKNAGEIDTFLAKYKGTPLDWPLRKKWLNYLVKRNNKTLFIKAFRPTSSAELTCHYYRYQLSFGADKNTILPKVTKLWLAGKSQPKACDPLFKLWRESGYLTYDIVWQRIRLAADGGDHTLLRYLGTLLPQNEQYLASLWKSVRVNPSYIVKTTRFPNKSDKESEIITYGLKRLIWRKPDLAIKTYDNIVSQQRIDQAQQKKVTAAFAIALASKNHDQAQSWLHQVDNTLVDKNIGQWRIAHVLRNNDWQAIKAELLLFPQTLQTRLQWQYWYGRSLIETGETAAGTALLTKLADNRHYYGFLAASHMQQAMNYQHKPVLITEQEKIAVLRFPSAKRAFELFHLGRFSQARKEWNYWLTKLDDRQKLVASRIAYENQWYDRAIFALSAVGYLNDVELRFPLAFDEDIQNYSSNYNINPAWAFAIARRESSFMSDANSPAGARGLMQVMPKTAVQLKKAKLPRKYLFDAQNNIDLGTKYLKELLEKFDGNSVLATASYNAGPYRVSRWLEGAEVLPADMWIETIPYKETREYVKSVMAYKQIYQVKVGQEETVFDQLIKTTIK
ncbi:transglycosylase SLT domain-containing protein [Thalassotalea sp. PLHSN55]|uniref:transglycosylase SLT domain-containing protein n=1 Tax=Thalassotalea sp. PLHSN55 TaxID=3435888 RepID=UPI003F85E25D